MNEQGQPITGTKADKYMREWMDLHAVSSFQRAEQYLYGTARNRMNEQKEYRIERYMDSAGQYNVHERPVNSEQEWEWVDAINVE